MHKIEFDIEYWIKELNRNVPQYRFVTYINHSIILFKGEHYDASFMFIKRSYEFLVNNRKDLISSEYLISSNRYLKELYNYLIKNNLVREELISKYEIKNKANTGYK